MNERKEEVDILDAGETPYNCSPRAPDRDDGPDEVHRVPLSEAGPVGRPQDETKEERGDRAIVEFEEGRVQNRDENPVDGPEHAEEDTHGSGNGELQCLDSGDISDLGGSVTPELASRYLRMFQCFFRI